MASASGKCVTDLQYHLKQGRLCRNLQKEPGPVLPTVFAPYQSNLHLQLAYRLLKDRHWVKHAHLFVVSMLLQMFEFGLFARPSLAASPHALHVQRSHSRDIPLNHLLCTLHLGKKLRISNDSRRVLYLPAGLIKPSDDSNDGSF